MSAHGPIARHGFTEDREPVELDGELFAYRQAGNESLTAVAVSKRDAARAALWARFQREAEGTDLETRLKLSHSYQEHLDNVEREYRRDMARALNLALVRS